MNDNIPIWGMLAIFAFGIFQIYAGAIGLGHQFGTVGAILGILALFFLRFSLPLTIGCFIACYYVWDLNLFLSLLITAPFLLMQLFLITGGGVSGLFSKFKSPNRLD